MVVGDGAVGKTSLLIVQATGEFPTEYVPTVFENYTAQVERNGQEILLHLWDTAGQEDYDRLRPLSYPGADIVLLCFSTVNKGSFDAVRDKWSPEVTHYVPDIPHLLVGTKTDLREAGAKDPVTGKLDPIDVEAAKGLQKEVGAAQYHEVSAMKDPQSVAKLFSAAVELVMEARGESGAAPVSGDDGPVTLATGKTKKGKKDCILM